jgi:hypothetical protein
MCGSAIRKITKFATKGLGKSLRKVGAFGTGLGITGGDPVTGYLAGKQISKQDDKLIKKQDEWATKTFPSDQEIAAQEAEKAAAEKAASDKAATDAQNAIINDENSRLIQKKKRRAQGGSSLLTGAQSNQSLLY